MDAVRDRYPEHFQRLGPQRLPMIAVATAMLVLLLYGMEVLGFFDGKLLSGMGRLVEIAGLMLPPDPGSWAHARAWPGPQAWPGRRGRRRAGPRA